MPGKPATGFRRNSLSLFGNGEAPWVSIGRKGADSDYIRRHGMSLKVDRGSKC